MSFSFRNAAVAALLVGAAITGGATTAQAAGALALSQENRGGWAYGLVVGRPDTGTASRDAMRLCLGHRQGVNCRVLKTFGGTCMGLAISARGNGFGWATRQSRGEAGRAALSACLDSNNDCVLQATNCD